MGQTAAVVTMNKYHSQVRIFSQDPRVAHFDKRAFQSYVTQAVPMESARVVLDHGVDRSRASQNISRVIYMK